MTVDAGLRSSLRSALVRGGTQLLPIQRRGITYAGLLAIPLGVIGLLSGA